MSWKQPTHVCMMFLHARTAYDFSFLDTFWIHCIMWKKCKKNVKKLWKNCEKNEKKMRKMFLLKNNILALKTLLTSFIKILISISNVIGGPRSRKNWKKTGKSFWLKMAWKQPTRVCMMLVGARRMFSILRKSRCRILGRTMGRKQPLLGRDRMEIKPDFRQGHGLVVSLEAGEGSGRPVEHGWSKNPVSRRPQGCWIHGETFGYMKKWENFFDGEWPRNKLHVFVWCW